MVDDVREASHTSRALRVDFRETRGRVSRATSRALARVVRVPDDVRRGGVALEALAPLDRVRHAVRHTARLNVRVRVRGRGE